MEKPRDYTPEEKAFMTGFRKRPGMYLGNEGILSDFVHFLHGWNAAAAPHRNIRQLIPDGFQEFVEMRYRGKAGEAMGWFSLILEQEPDEGKAFRIFWELLDEYLVTLGYEPIPEDRTESVPFPHPNGIGRVYYTDLPLLAESYMRTFNGAPWFDRWDRKTAILRLKDLYRTPGFYGNAIWENGDPLGAVLGRSEHYFDGKCFQIVEFWIEPGVQKQGYGKLLMDELKGNLRLSGVKKIYLITMHSEQTEHFYQKNGFVIQDGLCVMQLPEF